LLPEHKREESQREIEELRGMVASMLQVWYEGRRYEVHVQGHTIVALAQHVDDPTSMAAVQSVVGAFFLFSGLAPEALELLGEAQATFLRHQIRTGADFISFVLKSWEAFYDLAVRMAQILTLPGTEVTHRQAVLHNFMQAVGPSWPGTLSTVVNSLASALRADGNAAAADLWVSALSYSPPSADAVTMPEIVQSLPPLAREQLQQLAREMGPPDEGATGRTVGHKPAAHCKFRLRSRKAKDLLLPGCESSECQLSLQIRLVDAVDMWR
jgi:hypothetical protein